VVYTALAGAFKTAGAVKAACASEACASGLQFHALAAAAAGAVAKAAAAFGTHARWNPGGAADCRLVALFTAAAAAVGELAVAWAAEIAPDIAALADMAALSVFGANDVVVVAPTPPETVVVETLEYDAGRPVTTPAPATTAWKFRNWSLLCRLH
jgi:hypothetical protein